jgi:hypothetical protein
LKKKNAIMTFAILLLTNGWASSNQTDPKNQKEKKILESIGQKNQGIQMNKQNFIDRHRDIAPQDMPTVVATTEYENKYIMSLIGSAIDVLKKNRILKEKDKDFGSGKYFWPKDPAKPVKLSISYDYENFELGQIFVNFKRQSQIGPWCSAAMLFAPKNYPKGVYQMNIPKSYFAEFTFKKSYREKRPNAEIKDVNIFFFELTKDETTMNLKFESRPDVSSLDDGYPISFHELVVETAGIDCKKSS